MQKKQNVKKSFYYTIGVLNLSLTLCQKNKIIVSKLYKEKSKIFFSFILQTILLIQLYPNKNSYYHNLYLYLFHSCHEDYYLLLIEFCPVENLIFILLDETKVENPGKL